MNTSCISCTTPIYAYEIEKFQRDVQLYGEQAPSGKQYTPRFGELCIAKYEADGKWYRGTSIEVVGDGFPTILFIDYGNICHVSIDNILPYPKQFTFPIYTFDCEIEGLYISKKYFLSILFKYTFYFLGLPLSSEPELIKKIQAITPNGSTIKCDIKKVDKEKNYYLITSTLIQALLKEHFLEGK